MKKFKITLLALILLFGFTGCGKNKQVDLNDEVTKIQTMGELVTMEAYFHNVAKLEKDKDKGIKSLLQKERKLWIDYTGIVKLGVDMTRVKISVKGNNQIDVFIPKAKIIGEPDIDDKEFNTNSFIESEDGLISNKLTMEDSRDAMALAQEEIIKKVNSDTNLLKKAQLRAKNLVEEYINDFEGSDNNYIFNWDYEE